MIERLSVENIALIDRMEIDFGRGLHVLSGETGAGKSLVIDSVNLVLGGRGDRELIQTGRQRAAVDAVFDLSDAPHVREILRELSIGQDDGELILSRELLQNGKNVCRINGRIAPLNMLRQIGELLMNVHGQHEHQALLDPRQHIAFLSRYGKERLREYEEAYARSFDEYSDVRRRLSEDFGSEAERARRMDMLSFQIKEIQAVAPIPGEEEGLIRRQGVLNNAERIANALNLSFQLLYQGTATNPSALHALGQCASLLEQIAPLTESFANLHARLNELYYSLEDVALEIRSEKNAVEYDPSALAEVEERLDALHKLKRKYGAAIPEVLEYLRQCRVEFERLNNSAHLIEELEGRLKRLHKEAYQCALRLSDARRRCASELERALSCQLSDLGMGKSSFSVAFEPILPEDQCSLGRDGLDKVEFLISPNTGEAPRPLSRIASGGELSRLMLALKSVSADLDDIPSLVFDEIDTGISGRMAQTVAEKMAVLSRRHQVVCVTHLSQIAAMADRHYLIHKQEVEGRTRTDVHLIDAAERTREIARLAGGNETDLSLAHADELLGRARKIKMSL